MVAMLLDTMQSQDGYEPLHFKGSVNFFKAMISAFVFTAGFCVSK